MIDTDKYEGHDLSKEGWTGSDYIYNKKGDIIFDIDDLGGNEATLILLNDAPLLLAEVKRLREGMKMMLDDMKFSKPEEEIEYWLNTWKHWLKELIE